MDPESRLPEVDAPFWRTPEYRRHALRTSGALWAAHAMAFATGIVMARGLGPAKYGIVVLAVSATSVIATFLDLTLEDGVVHHGSRALEEGRLGDLRTLLRSALVVDLFIGAVVALGIVLAAGPVASLLTEEGVDTTLIRLAALIPLAATANGTTGAALLLARRPDARAWGTMSVDAARLLLVVVAVSLGGARAVIGAFVLATGIGAIVQAVLAWRIIWRGLRQTPPTGTMGTSIRTLSGFAVHSSLASSTSALHEALIPIVLARLAGPATVGVFAVAYLPVRLARLVIEPLRQAVFPEQARLAARGDRDVLRKSARLHVGGSLLIGGIGAIAGWFLLPYVIPLLYSSAFEPAIGPARILLGAAVLSLVPAWLKILAAAVGRPEVRTRITFLLVGLEFILVVVLAEHGASGAAAAVSLAYAAVALTWLLVLPRLLVAEKRPRPQSMGRERP